METTRLSSKYKHWITEYKYGFSTLELMIAFAILSLSLAATILVVFGNQSLALDSELAGDALAKEQNFAEETRAQARDNFLSVVSTSSLEQSGSVSYTKTLSVADMSLCKKRATSTTSWSAPPRLQKIELVNYFTDLIGAEALGRDCDPGELSGDWSAPAVRSTIPIGKTTGIDVVGNNAYITLANTTQGDPDLAIIDVTSSTSPLLLGSFDLGALGFTALDVARRENNHIYAYLAASSTVGQLWVVDVTDPLSPQFVSSSTLPDLTNGIPRSIYYYDKRVYIGTQEVPCVGCPSYRNNELHIFSVATPNAAPSWQASINVDRNVNAMFVRSGLAYVASGPGGDSTTFKIFDVDPSSSTYLQKISQFASSGSAQGRSIYVLGNRAYYGLDQDTVGRINFYVLDVASSSQPVAVASVNLGLHKTFAPTSIRVFDRTAFISTSDPARTLDVRDISQASLPQIGMQNLGLSATGIDLQNNTVYLSATSSIKSVTILGPAL